MSEPLPETRTCRSCAHEAPAAEFIPDMKFDWTVIPGSFVCRDADACFTRWLARALGDGRPGA